MTDRITVKFNAGMYYVMRGSRYVAGFGYRTDRDPHKVFNRRQARALAHEYANNLRTSQQSMTTAIHTEEVP